MLKIFFVLCIITSVVISSKISLPDKLNKEENYCYSTDDDPYKYATTKTAYRFVHGDRFYGKIPKCKPVQTWSLIRHGTRYPLTGNFTNYEKLPKLQDDILQNFKNEDPDLLAKKFCAQDIQLLKNWKWNASLTQAIASHLHPEGWSELKLLALRNKARFSELLSIPYSEQDFLFHQTKTERTEASFKAFANGLFGEESKNVKAVSFDNDTLIQTFKNCKYWLQQVWLNPKSLEEYYKFLNGPIYEKLISDVSTRLGFESNLNHTTIRLMLDMCRFDQAWNTDDKSPWCAVFTKDQKQILEYATDVKYYHLIGHGHELNEKVGCMPLKDMMERFENVITGNKTEPKGIFYFSHLYQHFLTMAAFDMKKDKIALTAVNMNQQRDRKWKTTILGPFAANINAILYECADGVKNRVAIYLNEKPYTYEGCSDGVCSWEIIKEKFLQRVQNCNMDFCQNDTK